MIATLSRTLLRVGIIAVLSFAGFAIDTAAAKGVQLGNHGRGEIKATCGANGGTYYDKGTGYGCLGSQGIVTCNGQSHTCQGDCKSNCGSVVKGGLNGILRPPASAGTASSVGGTATKRRLPVNQVGGLKTSGGTTGGTHPIVLQRSGGHSGGHK